MGTEPKSTDPKTIRFNDADDPDRLHRFERALARSAGSSGKVIRHLVDAYIRYVNEHGHSPSFPVRLVSDEPTRGKKR
jgi:hypothetical protein